MAAWTSSRTVLEAKMERSKVGEDGLGEFAREQLEMARRDPRLGRGPEAMVADFWDAVEEIERVRTLSSWGIRELEKSLEREEDRLGATLGDSDLAGEVSSSLQAAWERTEWAKAEIKNDTPHLHAQALVSLTSALDAYVDDFAAGNRTFIIDLLMRRFDASEKGSRSSSQTASLNEQGLRLMLGKLIPKPDQLRGNGAHRYEKLLLPLGLGAPEDRPIPADMAQALTELTALRNALVHRAARADTRALKAAPSLSLRYKVGDLIRMTRADYNLYSAAVRCYAQEIGFRPIRHWPEASDEDGPKLANWRDYYRIGV